MRKDRGSEAPRQQHSASGSLQYVALGSLLRPRSRRETAPRAAAKPQTSATGPLCQGSRALSHQAVFCKKLKLLEEPDIVISEQTSQEGASPRIKSRLGSKACKSFMTWPSFLLQLHFLSSSNTFSLAPGRETTWMADQICFSRCSYCCGSPSPTLNTSHPLLLQPSA